MAAALISLVGNSCYEPAQVSDGIRVFSFPNEPSLNNDSRIFRDAFQKNLKVVDQFSEPKKRVYANLFIQDIDSKFLSQANYNWLMVNQELFKQPALLPSIDLVLCKTRYAADLMKRLREKNHYHYKVLYTKFTSIVASNNSVKDYGLFLHPAGKSEFKNTGTVIDAWIANPQFPNLIVTCTSKPPYDSCKKNHLDPRGALPHQPNLLIYDTLIPHEKLEPIQNSAGFYLVPSEMEGYGHYINEARARGAVVITTDAPPMNELISDGITGFLIPYVSKIIYNKHTGSEGFSVDTNAIAIAIKRALAATPKERKKLAAGAAAAFNADKAFLYDRLDKAAKSVVEFNDLRGISDWLE